MKRARKAIRNFQIYKEELKKIDMEINAQPHHVVKLDDTGTSRKLPLPNHDNRKSGKIDREIDERLENPENIQCAEKKIFGKREIHKKVKTSL